MSFARCSALRGAALATVLFAALVAACGSDDSAPRTAAPTEPDAGAQPDTGGSVLPVPTTDAGAAPTAHLFVYLGQIATVDLSTLVGAEAPWQVLSAPLGSTIATATLKVATGPKPSFEPDVLGSYVLQTAVTQDGQPSAVVVLVEAVDAPIFWRESLQTGFVSAQGATIVKNVKISTHVGGLHLSSDRQLDCVQDRGEPDGSNVVAPDNARWGAAGGDTWEAPAGMPSRLVFPDAERGPNDTIRSWLAALTSATSCADGGARILDTTDGGVFGTRFSPDGKRIAYVVQSGGKGRVRTIAFDGTVKRELAPFTSQGIAAGGLDPNAGIKAGMGALNFYAYGPVPPRWKDASHVGWVTFTPTPGVFKAVEHQWELWTVEDRDGAAPQLFMQCTGSALVNFEFTADGLVVASTKPTATPSVPTREPMNILVYRPNPVTKACEVERNLTNNVAENAMARELSLSPDRSTVAFFSGMQVSDSLAPDSDYVLYLSTVPVDGSAPPKRVPGSTQGGLAKGPRWVAAGKVLTWGDTDSGRRFSPGSVLAIPAAGGTERRVAAGSHTEDLFSGNTPFAVRSAYAIGQGCNMTYGGGRSRTALGVGVGIGFAALLDRRRRARPVRAEAGGRKW